MASDTPPSVDAAQWKSQNLGFAYTAIAGYLDAVGYAELSGLYVSFMSGNTTRFGISLANGSFAIAGHAVFVIGLFVIGAAAGGFVHSVSRRLLILPMIQLLLLITCGTLYWTGFNSGFIYTLPVAMGLQNAAVVHHGALTVGKTFVTGSLVSFGQTIGKRIAGRPSDSLYQDGLSWLMFVIGVFGGALCWRVFGFGAAIFGASVLVAVIMLAVGAGERRGWLRMTDLS